MFCWSRRCRNITVECRKKIASAHQHQGASVAHHSNEVDQRRHHATEYHHQRRKILVHAFKQTVKSHHHKNQDHPSEQVAHDAETEEQLVSGDVVDGRSCVPVNKQLAGNIDKAQRADDNEEQVPESGHSPWIASHVPSLLERAYLSA